MSKYTTQVRFIVENYTTKFEGFPMSQRVEESLPKIFNFQYPIWDEGYRKTLEKKIIMHYFNKEIGLETVELWKFYLEERLNLIMPYYNEMYKTVSKDFEFLTSYNMQEEYDNTGTNISNSNSKNNTTSKQSDESTSNSKDNTHNEGHENGNTTGTESDTNKILKSDLPQANFAGKDYGTNLDESEGSSNNKVDSTKDYNSDSNSAAETKTNSTMNGNSENIASLDATGNTSMKYNRNTKGYNVSPTQLNLEYRKSLINIDNMIINELYDLFMLIY